MLRRRRPVARLATTAVVAGTAAHMGARSAQSSAAPAEAPAAPTAQAPSAAPTPPAAVDTEELKQLAALKDQGILTEEEFAAKKAQILGL